MNIVIEVDNLGKKYIINRQRQERYVALRDVIVNRFKKIGKKETFSSQEEFWAIKDVSFTVKQGDRVGIVGRNGSGKSTLLKLLSRITEPTTGRISIRGRVASLLEVGTGFHPELTGRENIYLNGAILGMRKSEIKRKFDEIVEFAEVEKFLDTPVKRYSSGMYVRLAFAVAAHLEPEILVVDEVLAVGDVQFQKKCLGKMEEMGSGGRTVLFVSHNMEAIEKLCTCGILLNKGQIQSCESSVSELIKKYIMQNVIDSTQILEWVENEDNNFNNDYFVPTRMVLVDKEGNAYNESINRNSIVYLQIEGTIKQVHPALIIGYFLYNSQGTLIYCSLSTDEAEENWPKLKKGNVKIISRIPADILPEGLFRIEMMSVIHQSEYLVQPGNNAPYINFNLFGHVATSSIIVPNRPGILFPVYKWSVV